MVVDTMSFEEITEYLNRNIFTAKRVNEILHKHIYPNARKYIKAMIKWKQNPNHTPYKIFNPITSKREYEEELVYVRYGVDYKYHDYILFTKFHYRGKQYVAYKLVNNRVVYYSWHALQRYAERFLHEVNPIINNEFIAKMLVYNTQQMCTNYTHNGQPTDMFVARDGSFLGYDHKNYTLIKTYISHDEYFDNQAALDKDAFEDIRKFIKETYGYWISRAA